MRKDESAAAEISRRLWKKGRMAVAEELGSLVGAIRIDGALAVERSLSRIDLRSGSMVIGGLVGKGGVLDTKAATNVSAVFEKVRRRQADFTE